MSERLRVVFDTQIYLRAAINPDSLCGKLFAKWTHAYTLYISEGIEREIPDVFTRFRIRARFSHITDETVKQVKSTLARAERIDLSEEDIASISRDPKDDIFLACAKAANANYLVSEDNDLLVLKRYEDTNIVNTFDFLAILENR